MFGLIEKLRAKPDRVKKQIAFFVSFLFAGIIFVIWLSIILPNFRQNEAQEARVSKISPSPTSAFSSTFSSTFSAIGSEFKQLKDSISNFTATPAYYVSTTTEVKN